MLPAAFWLVDGYGGSLRLRPPHVYAFGRDEEAHIEIDDGLVSRRHCELAWDDGGWRITDLASRNGTWVNGRRIGQPQPLADRDEVQVGSQRFRLVALPPDADAGQAVRAALREAQATVDGPTGQELRGELGPAGVLPMLQFLSATRRSGVLTLEGGGVRRIALAAGALRAARYAELTGEDALRAIVADAGGPGFVFADGAVLDPAEAVAGDPIALLASLATATSIGGVDQDDLRKAQTLQARLLARLPRIEGYDLGVVYESHAAVGGDFYDIGPLADGRQLIVIGDVAGHGVQAALVVAMTVKTLRLLREGSRDPVEVMARLNDALLGDLLQGQFVTAFAAALAPATGDLEVVLAGHHPAWIGDSAGTRPVGASGMALGLVPSTIMRKALKPVRVQLPAGALLIQVTDGLLEAVDGAREEYGEERMVARLAAGVGAGEAAQVVLDGLATDVRAFAGQLADDLTMIALRRR